MLLNAVSAFMKGFLTTQRKREQNAKYTKEAFTVVILTTLLTVSTPS